MSGDPLPTVEIPKVTSSESAAAPQPSATAQAEGGAVSPSAPSPTPEAEPVERRMMTLHSIVVEQAQKISNLKNRVLELEKRIDDFNTRSPHVI